MKRIVKRVFLFGVMNCFLACAEQNTNKQELPIEKVESDANKNAGHIGRSGAKFNDESALKYILGSDDYNMWGVLCRISSKAKEINSSKYTLLCPNNKALLAYGMDVVSLLKKPENIGLLDKLVEKHIINQPLTIGKLEGVGELKTIGGDILVFDSELLQVNGIALTTDQMITKQGIIIGLFGCIDFPDTALAKQIAR